MKDSGIRITESLTQKQIQILAKGRNGYLFEDVWTQNEKFQLNQITIPSKFIMTESSFGKFCLTIMEKRTVLGNNCNISNK